MWQRDGNPPETRGRRWRTREPAAQPAAAESAKFNGFDQVAAGSRVYGRVFQGSIFRGNTRNEGLNSRTRELAGSASMILIAVLGFAAVNVANSVGTASAGLVLVVTICVSIAALLMVAAAVMTARGRSGLDGVRPGLHAERDIAHQPPVVPVSPPVREETAGDDTDGFVTLGWLPEVDGQ